MNGNHYIIMNGELLKEGLASISPSNRGMMYGDGCFETLRCYKGKFLKWEQHFNRLAGSFDYLEMGLPFTAEELKSQVKQLLKKNDDSGASSLVRIQCWREGQRGYKTSSRNASWLIQCKSIQTEKQPAKLHLAQTRCIPNQALVRKFKLSNGLNYIKAAQEAEKAECDDAVMLTVSEKVSETTISNLFWIKEDVIFTPSKNCDLLPGITRSLIIRLCKENGITMVEDEFEISDLLKAASVFCTNSIIEIREVENIGNVKFRLNHPLLKRIKESFETYKISELKP